ncbi:hypothetical protein [Methanocella sp. MCL-LM]|uniref:hypothetical protein n=1 Tax=Methanocella sp. MCL-LM TaxID=3412035 RepID=UPI003C756472
MYLFTSDDRGMTEPYTDLPAIGLVSVGILLFGYLMTSAYQSYSSSAYYAQEMDDLRAIAVSMAGDPAIAADGSQGLLDAKKLDNTKALAEMTGRYGHPGSAVSVEIEAGEYHWSAGASGAGRSARYRIPVCVVLNDASTISGFLTVVCRECP